MGKYLIELKTDKNIGSREFLSQFIKGWFEQDEKIQPEFFDQGEPVKKSFNKNGIDAAINLWVDNQMPLMFKRIKDSGFLMDIEWRSSKGKDNREFPWGCTVWLSSDAGDEIAIQLFSFLCREFEPIFGFITTEQDCNQKHFITLETKIGIMEKYEGLDIGETVPGIYWKTFFENRLIDKIGREAFYKIPEEQINILNKGLLVSPYEDSILIGTEEGLRKEQKIQKILGVDTFFDKSRIDPRNYNHLNKIEI